MEKQKKREDIPQNLKWRLEDIIENTEEFEEIFKKCRAKTKNLEKYKNNLTSHTVIDCLKLEEEISRDLEKIYVFAHMKSDENTADNYYIEQAERVKMLAVEISAVGSFISPEIAKFPITILEAMISDEKYSDYNMYLKNIIRNKEHLLSTKEESILSNISFFSTGFKTIFQLFNNADIKFDDVEVETQNLPLTHGTYTLLLQNKNQTVRKKAFENMYKPYRDNTNTLAANYNGNVSKNVFYSRVRKFNSSLDAALHGEAIKPQVYENLINSVEKHTPTLHKYIALRKKILNLEENHMYDIYVPIVQEVDKSYSYNQAYEIVYESLKVLGDEYAATLLDAKLSRWIDVEETKNKRSGAYSWGVYGVHPYVLLNHNGTLNSVFTIAHEMGHAMHSHYANSNQPYSKAGYSIFVAEIASTVNEVLLVKYLLQTAEGDMRKYLLSYYLDMFRTTLFRQTMFAEFEKFAHNSVENGVPLSSNRLSDFYYKLNKKYYGESVIHDEMIRYEWSRIPHFYNAFYVYKYATGLTCSVNIANKILEGKNYQDKYLEFLKAGGSDYPLEILKKADIDLMSQKAYDIAMKDFTDTLDWLERMCK